MGNQPEQTGKLPQIKEMTIGNGLEGNFQTINFMKKIARERSGHPLIRKLTLNVLLQYQVPSNQYVAEALAVGDYVRQKVRYVRDPDNIEYLQDPLDLIQQIQKGTAQGDCDDMALLVATMLLSIGAQPFFRAVRFQAYSGNYNHIYVVVYDKNPYKKEQRIVLDCILKDKPIGNEYPHASGDDFQI